MDTNILLDFKERKRLISMMRGIKFKDIEIDSHFYNQWGKPRHGLNLIQVEKIYTQFNKIIDVFKRKDNVGFKHTFIYKLNKKKSYKLVFRLDRKPKLLLTAFYFGGNVEKRLMKGYGFKF
ncbi:MAG: hypothetical protein KKF68_00885 [Nanoarchaeota archaeon]|nr:hypothetical protein [Nanoarchaeota archaeon]